MSKAVMLSIRPKWCEKIVNGDKTIEVRKTVTSFFELILGVMLPSGTAASGQTARERLSGSLPATA